MADECEVFMFVFRGLLSGLMCIVGLVGNALSIAILWRIERTSVTFFLLRVLAVVDAVYLVIYIPAIVIPEFLYFSGYQLVVHGKYQYAIWSLFPVASMALTATVWVTTLVTVHRYVAISHHSKNYKLCGMPGTILQVCVVIVGSILVDIPKYFERQVVIMEPSDQYVNTSVHVSVPTALWHNHTYQLLYKNIAMIGLRKIMPILLTFVLSMLIIRALRRRQRWHQTLSRQAKQSSDLNRRLGRVLLCVAGVLVFCQTPMAVYPLLRLIYVIEDSGCTHFYFYFSNLADWLGVVNSATNFFIYYPAVPSFRQKLREMLIVKTNQCPADDQEPLSGGSPSEGRPSPAGKETTRRVNSTVV